MSRVKPNTCHPFMTMYSGSACLSGMLFLCPIQEKTEHEESSAGKDEDTFLSVRQSILSLHQKFGKHKINSLHAKDTPAQHFP